MNVPLLIRWILIIAVILFLLRYVQYKRKKKQAQEQAATDQITGMRKYGTACTSIDNSTNPPTQCSGYQYVNFWGTTKCDCGAGV